jgi:hypothetical protein
MPNILQVPVPNGKSASVWSSRDTSVTSLLFINQDLNNYVYLGSTSNITPTSPNVIPLAPNGTFSGDATSQWYVTGAAAGIQPLVVVPNGQAYFLGVTQGGGNLAIPSVQSPNFVSNVSGWQIDKNGNAQFNNLTLRGTFLGNNSIINANGAYWYAGTPAAGNLIQSITNANGFDPFGNTVLYGCVNYDPVEFNAIEINTATITSYTNTSQSGVYQQAGVMQSGGSAGGWVFENLGIGPTSAGFLSAISLEAQANPGVQPGSAVLYADVNGSCRVVDDADGQTYSMEIRHQYLAANSTAFSSATPAAVFAATTMSNRPYRISGRLVIVVTTAGAPQIEFGMSGSSTGSVTVTTTRAAAILASTDIPPNTLGGFATLAANTYECTFDGVVVQNTSGTFVVNMAVASGTGSFVINAFSYIDVMPF